MLKQLRSRKLMKRVLRVTLILIIPSFIMFYGWSQITRGGRGGGGEDFEFAKIKAKKTLNPFRWNQINRSEMKLANDQVRSEYEAMIANQIKDPNQMPDMRELVTPQQNIQKALENYVLEDYATNMKITVPMEEIRSLVESMFPQNTQQYFKRYLELTRQSEDYFVFSQSEYLKLAKAKLQIQSRAKVSLFECWLSYLELKEKLKVAYTILPASQFIEKVVVNEKDLKDFFDKNIKKYTLPDRVNYEYIAYTLKSFSDKIEVTDEEIKAYYDENKETQFKKPKEVSGRHILINCPVDAPEDVVNETKDKINKIYKDVKAGKDFAKLADEYSEDEANVKVLPPEEKEGEKAAEPKKEKLGGKFGPIFESGYSTFGTDFVTTVTALSKGTITEPMRSQKGWHIIKIEEVKPSSYESFTDVKDRIVNAVKTQKASANLNEKFEELKKIAANFTTLSSLAKETGLEVKETGLIDATSSFLGSDIQSISDSKDYIDELPKNEMSEVLKNFNAVFVVSKKEVIPSHDPTIEEVKNKVTEDFKNEKALELAKAEADKLAKEIQNAADLKKISEENKFKYAATNDFFTRLEPPNDFPNIKNFTRATLNTPKDSINVSPVLPQFGGEKAEGYAIWLITEKQEPSLEEFKKELPKLQEELLAMKRETLFREFIRSKLNTYQYQINPEYISQ